MLKSVTLLSRKFGFDLTNAGVGRIATELKAGLEARGINVIPISSDDDGDNYRYLEYSFFTLIDRKLPVADVYHAITQFEGLYTPKNKGIVTICDLIPMTHPEMQGAGVGYSWWKRQLAHQYFTLTARVSTHCRYVVTISELSKYEIIKYLKVPESKVKIIRLGIPEYLKPEPKQDDVYRIGYLGQLDRRKRIDLLIKAFKEADIDGELVIGGIGRDEAMLKALAGDDRRIKFFGFVPNADLCHFYNSLSVFCFPTMIEGLGLPILEAWACKKPVIVLGDAIITPEIKERCIVAKDYDALVEFLKADRILATGNDNYEYAKSFSWRNTVNEYLDLYTEVMND